MDNYKKVGIAASGNTRGGMTFFSKSSPRTDYVFVDAEEEKKIVFEVINEVAQNRSLTDPDAVRFIEDGDDLTRQNVYVSTAIPVSTLGPGNKPYYDPYMIAAPGSTVYAATSEMLSAVYSIAPEEGREKIGYILHRDDVPIYLDLDDMIISQSHMAIVGRTGCGKSWFTTRWLDKLKMKYIVFSPTDEYDSLSAPHDILSRQDFSIPLSPSVINHVVGLTTTELNCLKEFIKRSGLKCGSYSGEKLSLLIEDYYRATTKAKAPQLSMLGNWSDEFYSLPQYVISLSRKIADLGLKVSVSPEQDPIIRQSTVFNMQGCKRVEEEQLIYSVLLPIFERRKAIYKSEERDIPIDNRIIIVLEEAQNYAPSNRSTLCKDLLVDIARVGRKYGMHIVMISQRPRYIDQTMLAQCGCSLFFHLPNPEDVDYVMSAAALNRSSTFKAMIQNFDTGQCILVRAAKSALDLLCKIDF